MALQNHAARDPDYDRCNYGSSRLTFRGPFRMPHAIDVAVLGGTETFGKFVAMPYPALLERRLGRPVVNLGVLNGGVDSFMGDTIIEEVAQRARVAVVQVTGAQGVTNAFYRVHARRNDRVIAPTKLLRRRFPRVDCADVTFVRHLLSRLAAHSPEGYGEVVAELRRTWVGRMKDMVARLAMPTVFLWISERPPAPETDLTPGLTGGDPLFVTRDMLWQVAQCAEGLVEVVRPFGAKADLAGMVFSDIEAPAAARLPGPAVHAAAAQALAQTLEPALGTLAEPMRKWVPGRS